MNRIFSLSVNHPYPNQLYGPGIYDKVAVSNSSGQNRPAEQIRTSTYRKTFCISKDRPLDRNSRRSDIIKCQVMHTTKEMYSK